MLILILIGVQYRQNAVFALEKVRIVKITPQVLTTLQKNSPPRIPPTPYCYLENPVQCPGQKTKISLKVTNNSSNVSNSIHNIKICIAP